MEHLESFYTLSLITQIVHFIEELSTGFYKRGIAKNQKGNIHYLHLKVNLSLVTMQYSDPTDQPIFQHFLSKTLGQKILTIY